MINESAISWDECLRSLNSILPGLDTFAFNKVSDVAEKKGLKIEWQPLRNWEDLGDNKILDAILEGEVIQGRDQAILLPASCFYGDHLPFLVCRDDVRDFIGGFLVRFGECFFNGDTLILLPSLRTICLFHHEGVHCKIRVL